MSDVLKVPAPFVSDIYKEASGDIEALSTVTYRDHRDAWVGKMFPACVQNPIIQITTAKPAPQHKSDTPLVVGVSVTVVGLVIVVAAAIVVVSVIKKKGGPKSRYAGKRDGTSYGALE